MVANFPPRHKESGRAEGGNFEQNYCMEKIIVLEKLIRNVSGNFSAFDENCRELLNADWEH